MSDDVKNPSHYTALDGSGLECIQMQKAMLGHEAFRAHCRAAAFKYAFRAGRKNNAASEEQDLRKAMQYLQFALDSLAEQNDAKNDVLRLHSALDGLK